VSYIKLFDHHVRLPYFYLGILEFNIHIAAVYISAFLWLPDRTINLSDLSDPFYVYALIYSTVMLSSTLALDVYTVRYREGFIAAAIRTIVSYCLLASTILSIFFDIFPHLNLGSGLLAICVAMSFILGIPSRWVFYEVITSESLKRRVLVLGAGRNAKEMWSVLEPDRRYSAFQIVGFLDEKGRDEAATGLKMVKYDGSLLQCSKDLDIDEIVVALDERRRSEGGTFPLRDLLDCKLRGVFVTDAVAFCERERGKIELSLISPSWMVFSTGFKFSQARDIIKRTFDIFICIVLLFLTLPLMLMTALMVFLEDGSPVFFKQVRVGLNNKEFTLYKFRSMRKDAEKDGAQWAKANDNRVTKVGAFIRNTRLDELPQIYNILRGDMSFVGPRPERPEFTVDLAEKIDFYNERHRVKPGMMGWAQLKYPYGASIEDARNKLKYDLYYTKNHSLLLDMLIVLQTVEIVLLGKGVR
jgi:sugar transferase (PEP-CTERM system associated)